MVEQPVVDTPLLPKARPINLWPGLPSPLKPRGLPGSIMVEAEARGRKRRIIASYFENKKRLRKRFEATVAGHADAVLCCASGPPGATRRTGT